MRRALFGLIGATGVLLTVGTSWLAAYVHTQSPPKTTTRLDTPEWTGSVPDDWPSDPDWTRRYRGFGFTRLHSAATPPGWGLTERFSSSGWPLRSMYTRSLSVGKMFVSHATVESSMEYQRALAEAPSSYTQPSARLISGWYLGDSPKKTFMFRNEIRLPLAIVPVGFLTNVLFWSCVSVPLVLGPRWLVRRHRRRSQRCASCGYEIGDLVVCPECGAEA